MCHPRIHLIGEVIILGYNQLENPKLQEGATGSVLPTSHIDSLGESP